MLRQYNPPLPTFFHPLVTSSLLVPNILLSIIITMKSRGLGPGRTVPLDLVDARGLYIFVSVFSDHTVRSDDTPKPTVGKISSFFLTPFLHSFLC